MPTISTREPTTVLVTGANGFIGTWICKTFLESGYRVRGAVRSHSKGRYLVEIFKDHAHDFLYHLVEDITKPGAFDEAVKGVEAVIHTASPDPTIEDLQDIMIPAVNGTLELIHSVNRCGLEVKRIVYTSSGSAIIDPTKPAGTIYNDDDWNTWSVKQVEEKGKDAGWDKYRASKVLAERAAWEEVKKQDQWDLVAIHPLLTLGPIIHQVTKLSELNLSSLRFYNVLSAREEELSSDALLVPDLNFSDVRDVALAHLRAAEHENAGGQRFITCNGAYTWQDALDLLPDVYSKPLGTPGSGKSVKHTVFDSTKSRKMLDLEYRDFEETIKDTAFEFYSRGWLPVRVEGRT
ncbi:unnamed protein product [Rhizoctonia solani]|uniref:NAD-dependent epimerase/dehydratase domain-containing protein n=1 Tax=Rhizoctonia solani TaxID=456999 RepID=A0A8H3CS56_9AGAM|nr:unnamed protein product [Rhizoctonia solani]